jgi:uncharacterized membrane protein
MTQQQTKRSSARMVITILILVLVAMAFFVSSFFLANS